MATSEQRVDERGDRATLREHDQAAEQGQHNDDGEKPELPPLAHKRPELGNKRHHGRLRTAGSWCLVPAQVAGDRSSMSTPTGRVASEADPSPPPASTRTAGRS